MLEIVTFPDPILRERMPEFDFSAPLIDPNLLQSSMIECMKEHNGVGLSANQVGIRTRMFVMGTGDKAIGIFNPIIEEATGTRDDYEGCLSFPGIITKVKRPDVIKARWQDHNGDWQQAEMVGLTAKCFLHEYDHLEGIVFQDRISQLKWALAVKKSKKRKGKF